MPVIQVDTGRTLSVFSIPGQDTRIPTTKSDSIFTFGSFRIERNFQDNSLTSQTRSIQFGPASTLVKMNAEEFNPQESFSIKNNELKFNKKDPLSYSYFGSFYTAIATVINDIVENYPYSILAYDNSIGTTIENYSVQRTGFTFNSTFRIPVSATTNQGQIVVNSGVTSDISLANRPDIFAIQFSGSSNTEIYEILNYKFISTGGTTSFMEFTIDGRLYDSAVTATTFQDAIYVRPTRKRLNGYLNELSRLGKQVWLEKKFLIPNAENPGIDDELTFSWPKTIDGINPNISGQEFLDYQEEILAAAERVDEDKTNIMVKVLAAENFLEQDTEEGDFRSLLELYSIQFDDLKQFIDSIAFAHRINYQEEESVPDKFLFKLSRLFGWELADSFNETDLFEYLVGGVEEGESSSSELNVEIWKRILINIVWLYKKKGTRDALQFIFKLIGAPDCLVNLNEFVYDIKRVSDSNATDVNLEFFESPVGDITLPVNDLINEGGQNKINENGYINYNASEYIFQEGGPGRGDGQRYITQWEPEFDPIRRVDNVKVQTGSSEFFGTQHIMNTKEFNITLDPAQAIECDMFEYFKSTGTSWVWGTTGDTFAFSSLTVPFEYLPSDIGPIDPSILSAMTFAQFIDHIYANTVDPRNRKTVDQNHTSFWYQELKKLYLIYYYNTSPRSNRLTFRNLEFFIELLEVQLEGYFDQLIPATTIFQGLGTEYRNTVFNRQKFVYKEGINIGSEFQSEYMPPIEADMNVVEIESIPNSKIDVEINVIEVSASLTTNASLRLRPVKVVSNFPIQLNPSLTPVKVDSVINHEN